MVLDKSIIQKCFRNHNSICDLDNVNCKEICNFFVSFDKDLIIQVNNRLKYGYKLKNNDPVDRWRLNLAYGCSYPNDNSFQEVL